MKIAARDVRQAASLSDIFWGVFENRGPNRTRIELMRLIEADLICFDP